MTQAEIEALREEACIGLDYPEVEHRFALFLHYAEHYRKLAKAETNKDSRSRLYDKAEEATRNALDMIGPGRRAAR